MKRERSLKMDLELELLKLEEQEIELAQRKIAIQRRVLQLKLSKEKSSGISVTSGSENIKADHQIHFEEDEKAEYWYVVKKGIHAGIHTNLTKIHVPYSDTIQCHSKAEAEEAWKKCLSDKGKQAASIDKCRGLNTSDSKGSKVFNLEGLNSSLIQNPSMEDWIIIQNKAKQIAIHDDKYHHVLKRKECLLIALKGSLPQQYFSMGLIDTMYLSKELTEVAFNKPIQKCLKNYMEKTGLVKAKKEIFLKIFSTIPDWELYKFFEPYYLIKVGVVRDADFKKTANKGSIHQTQPTKLEIDELRVKRFDEIYLNLKRILKEKNSRVLGNSENYLVYTKGKMSEKDKEIIQKWIDNLDELKIKVSPITKGLLSGNDIVLSDEDFPKLPEKDCQVNINNKEDAAKKTEDSGKQLTQENNIQLYPENLRKESTAKNQEDTCSMEILPTESKGSESSAKM